MYTQHARNTQQRGNADVPTAGLCRLVCGSGHAGGEEHLFLGHALSYTGDADAVADSEALTMEPVFVVGQVGHSSETRPTMIASQPFIEGLS